MKTLGAILIAVAIAGAAGFQYWRGFGDRPRFRTVPVMRGDLFIGVTATGTVEPVEIIDVGAQIVGSIKKFGDDADHPGQSIGFCSRVKAGSILTQLDDLPHQAELDKARVNEKLAEAELNFSRAKQKQMEQAFARAKKLKDTDSLAEFEKAEAEDAMARA